ncbi:MAG TPA: hypothetical protein PKV71_07080 [Calditrichia bacterium]|nr:hypothetical protein [Calditrichia bacterium]
MKRFAVFIALMMSIFLLLNCSEDSTGPTEEPSYQLFPNGYFSTGFREEYSLVGSSQSGTQFTGTHLELTQSPVTFGGQQTAPVTIRDEWADNLGGSFLTSTAYFYSTDGDNRQLLGIQDQLTTGILTPTTSTAMPVSAKIGDSGQVGVYSDGQGNTLTQTWELQAGENGRAKMVLANQVRDANNTLVTDGNVTFQIDEGGTRYGMTIFFDLKILGDPVNWTGTKL